MILYRFELDKSSNIHCIECHAVNDFVGESSEHFIYRVVSGHQQLSRLFKDDIAKVDNKMGVFLLENDIKKAAEIFLEYQQKELDIEHKRHASNVNRLQESVAILSKTIGKE